MRYFLMLCLAFATAQAASSPAFAHARWFIDEPNVEPVFFTFGPLHVVLAALTVAFLLAAWGVDRLIHRWPALHQLFGCKISDPRGLGWRVMAVVFGGVLIINSMEHVFLAPNLAGGPSGTLAALLYLQILLGSLLMAQTRMTEASLALLLLPILGLAVFPASGLVDYAFEIAAVGVSLYMLSPLIFERDKAFRRQLRRQIPGGVSLRLEPARGAARTWAISWPNFAAEFRGPAAERREASAAEWLRVMLGAQLVVLAAHDKILYPGVSLAFVDMYPFVNFPALLGFGFSNLDFVYAAGLAEAAFGIALMFNLAVRMVSFAMLSLFTLTGVLFGLSEMMGHLPILAILGVIFIQGSGRHLSRQTSPGTGSAASRAAFAGALAMAAGIFVVFIADPGVTKAQARAQPTEPPPSSAAAAAFALPNALLQSFRAEMPPRRQQPRELQEKIAAVTAVLSSVHVVNPTMKNDVAFKFFELSIAYEATIGRDAAAAWLRYANLTSSCAPDEIANLRRTLANGQWWAQVSLLPASYHAVLMPVARTAARGIVGRDAQDGVIWAMVAAQSSIGAVEAEHLHTLAAIARIAYAAAGDGR